MKLKTLTPSKQLAVTTAVGMAIFTLLSVGPSRAKSPTQQENGPAIERRPVSKETFDSLFTGFKGCFVEQDSARGADYLRYNEKLASERLSPCSTFKIPNSMIGLETGVLQDENHPMRWDGTVYDIKAWNADQTLQSAVKNSVVWYFQREAAEVGKQRMQHYLNLINYGNKDISGGQTEFWLQSSLKISAEEQVKFLNALQESKLPFSQRTINITKGLILLKETPSGKLYGKTGTGRGRTLGWFVGYVVHNDRAYPFATNIRGKGAWGMKAREISEAILEKQGLL